MNCESPHMKSVLYRHIWLFCVPVSWCANAYNEDDLAGESWYTEKVCMYRDRACNEKLLYCQLG